MNTEYEAKFIEIDPEAVRQRLQEVGAQSIHEERILKRRNYDFSDNRLDREKNGWVRLRDEGDKITLAYKQLEARTVTGTKEASIVVNSLENADRFLIGIGLEMKSYQETKRESWSLNGIEIEIDTWPWIPQFVEIEGPTEEAVKDVAEQLGFSWVNAMFGSVENVYAKYYDVTEQEVCEWNEIKFIDIPDWLEAKRR